MHYSSVREEALAAPAVMTDAHSVTVIGGYVASIIHALEARGVATQTILHAAGITAVPSNDPLTRIPLTAVRQLLDAAVELTGDSYFGLYAANFVHTSNLHALGYAMLASGTLRELCERLARNFRMLTSTTKPVLIDGNGTARLEFRLV